ncbi:hypothetical protein KVR01_013405 [Diaporthe batatas]|uniref:uncharacterized protein n=1 Tax=Diaporthe batatas TaxID=748121 RepID=UPI001D041A78|nr:uncharacterized protein KVR01_013405 [Diaporthe batatas]KAG8156800.1 hypothetical protein KVR01_013405 [Diaporthe batatas]
MLLTSLFAGFIATASAASIPRQTEQTPWSITNFFASSNRFSVITTYRFDITDGNTSAYCVALMDTTPDISYVPITDCDNPIYSFAFGSAADTEEPGFNLQIWQGNPEDTSCGAPSTHCVYTGIKFFPATDVETIQDPTGNPFGNYDRLNAPADFEIARNSVHI